MKLEDQVVSIELAKRMKELGLEQGSLFWWQENQNDNRGKWEIVDFDGIYYANKQNCFSAYTVAELGEMLPTEVVVNPNHAVITLEHPITKYIGLDFLMENTKVWRTSVGAVQFKETTEADARAKILIYLKERKLL